MGINVFWYSTKNPFKRQIESNEIYPNIFLLFNKYKRKSGYIGSFLSLIKIRNRYRNTNTVYVFYPSSKFLIDFIILFIFKVLSNENLFCEINELRRAYVLNRTLPQNIFKKFIRIIQNLIDIFFYKILENLSFLYNGILTISSNLDKYYSKYNSNRLIVPILVEMREYQKAKLRFVNVFEIGFFGSVLLSKEGFLNFIEAIRLVNEKSIIVRLNIFGHIEKNEAKKLFKLIHIINGKDFIQYHGEIEKEKLFSEMAKMNLLVLPRPNNLQNKYGFSTKLGEYMISGVPVLVTNVSDNSKYIIDAFNGYIIDNTGVQDFYNKLVDILKEYEIKKYLVAENAYLEAKKSFDYSLYCDKLNTFLFYES